MPVVEKGQTIGCSANLEKRAAGVAWAGRYLGDLLKGGGTLPSTFTIYGEEFDVTEISATADGSADQQTPLAAAVSAGRGGTATLLVLPPATLPYRYSHMMSLSPNTYLCGYGATLMPLAVDDTAIYGDDDAGIFGMRMLALEGAVSKWPERFALDNTTLASKDGTVASALGGGNDDDAWIRFSDKTNVIIKDVDTVGSIQGFIRCYYSTQVLIEGCVARRTHSDPIHVVKKSTFVTVQDCRIYDAGDDAISVVSYKRASTGGDAENTAPPSNILIQRNHVKGGRARGLTVVGGFHVCHFDNVVEDICLAGFRYGPTTAQDTFDVEDVTARRNLTINCSRLNATNPNSGKAFALLSTASTHCTGIVIADNEARHSGQFYASDAFVRTSDGGGGISFTETGSINTAMTATA